MEELSIKNKELLFNDLCARLPYDCNVTIAEGGIDGLQWNNVTLNSYLLYQIEEEDGLEYIKPYLRPMSSVTEEEKREIYNWLVENDIDWFDFSKLRLDEILISFDSSWLLVDWLNKHHFDYHGLIEKGLAIAVTEENNPYK